MATNSPTGSPSATPHAARSAARRSARSAAANRAGSMAEWTTRSRSAGMPKNVSKWPATIRLLTTTTGESGPRYCRRSSRANDRAAGSNSLPKSPASRPKAVPNLSRLCHRLAACRPPCGYSTSWPNVLSNPTVTSWSAVVLKTASANRHGRTHRGPPTGGMQWYTIAAGKAVASHRLAYRWTRWPSAANRRDRSPRYVSAPPLVGSTDS